MLLIMQESYEGKFTPYKLLSTPLLYYSELVKENGKYRDRTDEPYKEEVCAEQPARNSTPVGKLIMYKFLWHKPPQEHTSQHTTHRQEYLSGQEVEEVEKAKTCYPQSVEAAE